MSSVYAGQTYNEPLSHSVSHWNFGKEVMACCKPCHGIGVNWTPGTATLGSLDSVSKLKSLLTLSYLATEKYLEIKMQSHSWLRSTALRPHIWLPMAVSLLLDGGSGSPQGQGRTSGGVSSKANREEQDPVSWGWGWTMGIVGPGSIFFQAAPHLAALSSPKGHSYGNPSSLLLAESREPTATLQLGFPGALPISWAPLCAMVYIRVFGVI